jgi:hypothetical protein
MGGRLYVQGIPEGGPWDASRLVRWDSSQVDKGYHPLAGDRKVESAKELLEVLHVSERGLPAIKVWIRKDLGASTRRAWEENDGAYDDRRRGEAFVST